MGRREPKDRFQGQGKCAQGGAKFIFPFRVLRDGHFDFEIYAKLTFYHFAIIWRREKDPWMIESAQTEAGFGISTPDDLYVHVYCRVLGIF